MKTMKINIVLASHQFWGCESRLMMTSLKQTANVLGDDLTREHLLSRFRRVVAQGMLSPLPARDEADNPDFLKKRTEHKELTYE